MPAFVPPPNQFSPKRGSHANDEIDLPGCEVTLFGTGFDAGDLSVKFGEVEATSIISRTSAEIRVNVPAMEGPRAVQITVRTGGGTTTSDEEFGVPAVANRRRVKRHAVCRHGRSLADDIQNPGPPFHRRGRGHSRCPMRFSRVRGVHQVGRPIGEDDRNQVQWPDVPNHHRFIGVQAFMKVERSDGGLGQLEFEIKGL